MSNINLELEDDDYYDKFLEESSPRTNYGDEHKFKKMKDEYIIINKTAIEERVKELEKEIYELEDKTEDELVSIASHHDEDEVANAAMKVLKSKFDSTYFSAGIVIGWQPLKVTVV